MKTFLAAILLFPCLCLAGDLPDLGEPGPRAWSPSEIATEAATVALFVIDAGQTRDIGPICQRNAECQVYERNPLLGKHPSNARIRNYFTGVIAAHIAITHLLPQKYRALWQGTTMMLEIGITAENANLGLKVNY